MLDRVICARQITKRDAAETESEQLVEIVEIRETFHLRPVAALDHMPGPHRGQLVAERYRTVAAADLALDVMLRGSRRLVERSLYDLNRIARFSESALLQILVVQPR